MQYALAPEHRRFVDPTNFLRACEPASGAFTTSPRARALVLRRYPQRISGRRIDRPDGDAGTAAAAAAAAALQIQARTHTHTR